MFSSLVQTTPFIKSGQLIALGTGGAKRSPVLPDVPTIAEAGVPGYVADNWWGMVVPAGTPAPIVDKLYAATQAALQAPELKAQFDREGAAVVKMSSAEFAEYIKTEIGQVGPRRQGRRHQGAVARPRQRDSRAGGPRWRGPGLAI